MWLAEDGDTIVGIRNITPKRMKVLGTLVNAAESGDNFTHPDYQRRGISFKLMMFARESMLEKGVSLIYGIPGRITSLPGYMKKVNYLPVPIGLRELGKPLNTKQLLKVKRRIPPHLKALLYLAAFFWPIVKIVSDITTRFGAIGSAKSDISISKASLLPDDIDIFWEHAAKSYDIMLIRSKDYLEWRYIKNPDTYSILLATNIEGNTVGYIVTKIGMYDGVPVGYIVDFLTLEDDPGIFKKLLLAALKEFHQNNVSMVDTWVVKGGFYDKIFLKFGFLPYSKKTFICYQNELGNRIASSNYKWHFTMGDSDNI
jgi:GNAT superfamily N-acetyltransferase